MERSKNADNELKKYKYTSEKELLDQKEKLHNVLQGRVMLKSVLKGGKQEFSSSSSDDEQPPGKNAIPKNIFFVVSFFIFIFGVFCFLFIVQED